MKLIKIKFSRDNIERIIRLFIGQKRLFIVLFFGILLIYTFNVIYKNAYFNINYIVYTESEDFVIKGKRIDITLKRVMEDIGNREKRINQVAGKTYKDPFSFEGPENNSAGSKDDNNLSFSNNDEQEVYNSIKPAR